MARKVIPTPTTQFNASAASHAKELLANTDILAGDGNSKAIALLKGMIDDLINNDTTTDTKLTTTTTTAGAALPKAGGAMTGAITTNSTFDGVDIATRDAVLTSTTTTAGAALPKAGGAMTGAITTNSTFDGIDVGVDVAANTAKTGITSAQASAIAANTAKVSYAVKGVLTNTADHTLAFSVTNNRGTYALVIKMTDSSGRVLVTKSATIALS